MEKSIYKIKQLQYYGVFLIFTLIALNSCTESVSLSQKEVLEILKKDYVNYCEGAVNTITQHDNKASPKPIFEKFKALERKGLVILKKNQHYNRGNPSFIDRYWKPTNESIKRYKNKNNRLYKLTEANVTKIIGISINQEQKTAQVKFLYDMVATPFKEVQYGLGRKCPTSTNIEKVVTLVLYDTGWKLNK